MARAALTRVDPQRNVAVRAIAHKRVSARISEGKAGSRAMNIQFYQKDGKGESAIREYHTNRIRAFQ